MQQINMSSIYVVTEDAVESRLGAETVLLHLESGVYFGLGAVGTRVWELLKADVSPKVICETLRQEFTDTGDGLEADILGFLAQLSDHKLILEK